MKYFLTFFSILFLFACATTQEATWKGIPEVSIPYEKAWAIIVNAIAERFDVEVADAQSGYLRTGWKVTDTCWSGIFSGNVPCRKTRVTVRVEERDPLKVRLRVEKMEATALSGYEKWILKGNDEIVEREILDELLGRLRGRR